MPLWTWMKRYLENQEAWKAGYDYGMNNTKDINAHIKLHSYGISRTHFRMMLRFISRPQTESQRPYMCRCIYYFISACLEGKLHKCSVISSLGYFYRIEGKTPHGCSQPRANVTAKSTHNTEHSCLKKRKKNNISSSSFILECHAGEDRSTVYSEKILPTHFGC